MTAGRHVEVRLIGAPSNVEAVYQQIARALSTSRGTKKPTRDRDGRVIQHLTVTAPEPEMHGIGPRRVGGRYYCGYWRHEYTVLAIERGPGHAWYIIEATDEEAAEKKSRRHCTPWDPARDRVVSQPTGDR